MFKSVLNLLRIADKSFNIIYYFFEIVKVIMRILAIICEFNPFHNGHKYLIDSARQIANCDSVLCIMSGNFTQRGEACIFDKYTRAKHAVLGGADCVIQLPTPFAVAPAEVFAQGAIKILSAMPGVSTIAFGCESGTKEDYINTAKLALNENEKFKESLKRNLNIGESYVKSYAKAFYECGGNTELIESPNNILGLEYTKAILKAGVNIDILPVKRIGSGYLDSKLTDNFSSASAIRANMSDPEIKSNVPDYVFNDLKSANNNIEYESFVRNCLFSVSADNLNRVTGCGEGLENRLKSLENKQYNEIIENATSKRYSSSRIKRILCANALKLYESDVFKYLESELYLKPLAIKKQKAKEILSALSKSTYPVITGIGHGLSSTAAECFERDKYEFEVYCHINKLNIKDYMNLI